MSDVELPSEVFSVLVRHVAPNLLTCLFELILYGFTIGQLIRFLHLPSAPIINRSSTAHLASIANSVIGGGGSNFVLLKQQHPLTLTVITLLTLANTIHIILNIRWLYDYNVTYWSDFTYASKIPDVMKERVVTVTVILFASQLYWLGRISSYLYQTPGNAARSQRYGWVTNKYKKIFTSVLIVALPVAVLIIGSLISACIAIKELLQTQNFSQLEKGDFKHRIFATLIILTATEGLISGVIYKIVHNQKAKASVELSKILDTMLVYLSTSGFVNTTFLLAGAILALASNRTGWQAFFWFLVGNFSQIFLLAFLLAMNGWRITLSGSNHRISNYPIKFNVPDDLNEIDGKKEFANDVIIHGGNFQNINVSVETEQHDTNSASLAYTISHHQTHPVQYHGVPDVGSVNQSLHNNIDPSSTNNNNTTLPTSTTQHIF